MVVTDLILNFNKYLKDNWLYFSDASIERGMDSWDDWVELSFRIFVLNRISEKEDILFETDYGVWAREKEERFIKVSLRNDSKILYTKNINQYENKFEEDIIKNPEEVIITFREFNHPFMQENDEKAFEYVMGEVISNKHYSEGTKICIPLESCNQFYI